MVTVLPCEKVQLGLLISNESDKRLREMSSDDRRKLSAFVEVLIDDEWNRRHQDSLSGSNGKKRS